MNCVTKLVVFLYISQTFLDFLVVFVKLLYICNMKYRAYKYRLYSNEEQRVLIAKHLGCCRFLYNYDLDKKVKAYQKDKTNISRYQIQAELPTMKKSEKYCWLSDVNSLSLQAALANLDS